MRHSQVPQARRGAAVGDLFGPAAVRGGWAELLLQQVLGHADGAVARVLARPEPATGLGLECGIAHQPRDPVPTNLVVSSPQLLVDSRRDLEGKVAFKHRLHVGAQGLVLPGLTAQIVLPLPPGIQAAARHTQLPAKPGHRQAIRQLADQAKPLGGSCSFAK